MRFRFFFLPLGIAASCGGVIAGQHDAGNDAGGSSCTTNADCPNGTCAYSDKAGCSAQKQCFTPMVACKGGAYCACDGTTMLDDCSGHASKPVAHLGSCSDVGPIPNCGLSCEVCDVTGFTVSPMSKPETASNQCTHADISSFVAACLSASATATTCSGWQQSDAGVSGCGACILTPMTASAWGPIVCQANSCTINAGGCIDVVSGQVVIENGSNGSCGDLTNAADQCIDYACSACTTPSDNTTCANDAQQAECKSYFDAQQSASTCALFDAGTNTCSPQNDTDWAAFINVFCGTGP